MNTKYLVGSNLNKILHRVLSNQAFPLTRYFPQGYSVYYDVQRF